MKSYISLSGGIIKEVDNGVEWAKWIENGYGDDGHFKTFMEGGKGVVRTVLIDGTVVSTVFLGLDYNFMCGPPVLFETMIFEGNEETYSYRERYCTHEEALKGHEKAVRYATTGELDD